MCPVEKAGTGDIRAGSLEEKGVGSAWQDRGPARGDGGVAGGQHRWRKEQQGRGGERARRSSPSPCGHSPPRPRRRDGVTSPCGHLLQARRGSAGELRTAVTDSPLALSNPARCRPSTGPMGPRGIWWQRGQERVRWAVWCHVTHNL